MDVLASPMLWEALCSVVDADEDEMDAEDAAPVPNDDANRFATRSHDVGHVDWDHLEQLMHTREYGAW